MNIEHSDDISVYVIDGERVECSDGSTSEMVWFWEFPADTEETP